MTFKQFVENTEELRGRFAAKAEDIDYLIDVYIKWHHAMKSRKYWAGRNREQYQAAQEEEQRLAKVSGMYSAEMRLFAQEMGRRKLGEES
jgi:hypothetical protein